MKVSPTYKGGYDEGKYEFDSTTGVEVTDWKATDSLGREVMGQTGTFDEITVGDDTSYTITVTGTFSDGNVPHTNVGNDYANGQITSFSDSATSAILTGYRKTFWGTLSVKEELTSDDIRGLGSNSSKAYVNGNSFTVSIPVGALRVVIAYPANLRNMTQVLDENDSNANIVSGFGEPTTI
jgi:hypothetical protein